MRSAFSQDNASTESKQEKVLGLRYTYSYATYASRHIPTLTLDIGQHNFYIGPHFSQLKEPPFDQIDDFEATANGLNVGYRLFFYHSTKKNKALCTAQFLVLQGKNNRISTWPSQRKHSVK